MATRQKLPFASGLLEPAQEAELWLAGVMRNRFLFSDGVLVRDRIWGIAALVTCLSRPVRPLQPIASADEVAISSDPAGTLGYRAMGPVLCFRVGRLWWVAGSLARRRVVNGVAVRGGVRRVFPGL